MQIAKSVDLGTIFDCNLSARNGRRLPGSADGDGILAKFQGRHWMYRSAPQRLDVIVVAQDSFDPHDAPPRPRLRTTADYLRERESNGNT